MTLNLKIVFQKQNLKSYRKKKSQKLYIFISYFEFNLKST